MKKRKKGRGKGSFVSVFKTGKTTGPVGAGVPSLMMMMLYLWEESSLLVSLSSSEAEMLRATHIAFTILGLQHPPMNNCV